MRPCPVCFDDRREVIESPYCPNLRIYTPESGTSFYQWALYRCAACDMLYLDTDGHTEESLNKYYLQDYVTDDLPYSDERLKALGQCVYDLASSMEDPIMDIGGMDGQLRWILSFRGFDDVVDIGEPGVKFIRKYKIFILSHTLEHVYNTHGMLEKIKTNIESDGYVVVEGPIWQEGMPLDYDYHWQHINKFTPRHLNKLFGDHGFTVQESIPMPDYREYHCHRLIARYYPHE